MCVNRIEASHCAVPFFLPPERVAVGGCGCCGCILVSVEQHICLSIGDVMCCAVIGRGTSLIVPILFDSLQVPRYGTVDGLLDDLSSFHLHRTAHDRTRPT